MVARYRQLLARNPHDSILGQLVALYRRYRTLDELRASYAGEDWATLVVRARLARGHDDLEARSLFARAPALHDDDALSWIALAELPPEGPETRASPIARQASTRT